tara:strand:- start:252 stop:449 length:198 start_codon:yes stop_codon:yes gene_type:complete
MRKVTYGILKEYLENLTPLQLTDDVTIFDGEEFYGINIEIIEIENFETDDVLHENHVFISNSKLG